MRRRSHGEESSATPSVAPSPLVSCAQGAKWYLAWVVELIEVESHRRKIVHVNQILVRADSPAEAHRRAVAHGRECNRSYRNAAGQRVRIRFLGLRDLAVVHDDLEDGAELSYSSQTVLSEHAARALVQPKRKLGVFTPRRAGKVDYMSAGIRQMLDDELGPGWR